MHHRNARFTTLLTWLSLFLIAISYTERAQASDWQSVDTIASTAERFLQQRIGPTAKQTTVSAGALDVRLKLARCEKPLRGFLRPGTKITARTIVGVRCTGSKPWKVYVPVRLTVAANVYVARRALPKGHLLSSADVELTLRDVSRSAGGYLSDPAQLLGQRLKSPVMAGAMLSPRQLQADNIVKRGQTVTLTANSAGVTISMSGRALSDGAVNQRIRVENLNSGRTVEGIVRSREQVEVLMGSANTFFPVRAKD